MYNSPKKKNNKSVLPDIYDTAPLKAGLITKKTPAKSPAVFSRVSFHASKKTSRPFRKCKKIFEK